MCCLVFGGERTAGLPPEDIAGGLIKYTGNAVRGQDGPDMLGVRERVRGGPRVQDLMEHPGRYDGELGFSSIVLVKASWGRRQ